MTRLHSFQTAAARRSADPFVLDIDGTRITMRDHVDITELGTVVEQVAAIEDSTTGKVTGKFATLGPRRAALVDSIRLCVHPDSADAFAGIADRLDIGTASEILKVLIPEYAGAGNPTGQSSSSDGS